jgi:hypothetical protein
MPDSGANSIRPYKHGPSLGSSSAPSFSVLQNPQLVTSKISLDTNVTTSVPLMIRPWLDKYEKSFVQGSVLFSLCNKQSHRLATVADLPTLNYLLENTFHVTRGTQEALYKKTPKEVMYDGWNYFGILRNDMLAESNLQKLLNVDAYGRAMIGNIFGKLKRGDHVGLALAYVNTATLNQGFVLPNGNILPEAVIEKKNANGGAGDGTGAPEIMGTTGTGTGTYKILQYLPTVNNKIAVEQAKDSPILQSIPLGVVSHAVAKLPSDGLRKRALRSQTHHVLLPLIEILII